MFDRRFTRAVAGVGVLSLLACNENAREPTATSGSRGLSAAVTAATTVTTVSINFTSGFAQLVGPTGITQFKFPPTGDGQGTNLQTGAQSVKLNGLDVNFRTGLVATPPPTNLTAHFSSADGISVSFGGFFEQRFYTLDGTVKPDGGSALRVLGTLSLNRFGSFKFASISLFFFWPDEGGVCEIFMNGPFTET